MLMGEDDVAQQKWDHDDVAENDHLSIDIEDLWDILGENYHDPLQNCTEDISAGEVLEEGLPELEMATSNGNGDIVDFEYGTSDISSESISGDPFVYNHQNQELSAQGVSPSSFSLSDRMLADSDPNTVTNPLFHEFPSHGIDCHDESRHDISDLAPRFGLMLEDQSQDVSMEKLHVNHSDYSDSSEYITRMSDRSESAELSPMNIHTPNTWEPFGGYDPFIQNNIGMINPNDSWSDLSSQPTVHHNDIKYEDDTYALSNRQNPTNLNIGLEPTSPFLPYASADMYGNNLVSFKKQLGNNLVLKGLNYSSHNGTHKKSPAGNGLSKMLPPSISWNLNKNISGHVNDEKIEMLSERAREISERTRKIYADKVLGQKNFPSIMKREQQIYDVVSESANKKLNLAVGDHTIDSKVVDPFYPQSFTNKFYCLKDEPVTAHSTALVNSFQVEDDDVCIIEGPGAPLLSNSLYMDRKAIDNSKMLPIVDPLNHVGMGGVKVKANDERLVLRVALQDLSQPKTEASPPVGVMAVPLLKHQRIALSWMVQKETGLHCCGGFLADDQGLGKTISTIALIVKEKPPTSPTCTENKKPIKTEMLNLDEDDDFAESSPESSNRNSKSRQSGGTLVVCPTSVLRQWADEIRDKITPRERLSVLIYHGSNRTKDPSELAKYDVVLTTYSIVSMEVPKQPLVDKDETSKKRKYAPTSKKSRKKVREKEKDLFVGPLAKVGWFRVVLDEAQSIKNYKTQVARACWGLRAKRRWCLSGTPIQNAIDDLYSYFRFLRYEPYATHKSFVSSIKTPIHRNRTTGYKKLQAVLKTVMLRRTKGTILDGEPIINLPPKSVELKKVEFTKEERDFYCQLESDSRAQFEEYAAAGTVKQNYVNILLLLLRLRQACDHPLLVRRYDSSAEWKSSVEMAKKLPQEKQVALLSCLEASLAICGLCNDPPEDAVVTTCEHVFCYQCIYEYMGDNNQCPDTNCKNKLSAKSVFSTAALKYCLSDNFSEVSDKLEPSAWDLPFESSKIKAALEVLNSFCNPKPIIHDSPSLPKMSLDPFEIKEEVSDSDTDEGSKQSVKVNREKAIVFSQWTRMLDLLETGLKSSNIQYRRLDGTMSVLARDKAVKEFKTLPEVTVMIMSLKAASLGLNLVAACRVILLDLWWNPTTEDQAVDRAHRIGQTRPVSVLRLTVKDTVEDRILALQQKKREMVASAFGEDETGGDRTRLTVEDLEYLFRT